MSFSSDMDFEGHVVPLDTLDMETADRLLAGAVAPEDAPPGYADVTRLLQAAWTEPTPDEIPSEPVMVAWIADVVRSSSSTASYSPHECRNPIRLTRPRIAAALVAAVLACSAGLASAGALPDAIQEVASATLAKVGISVPDPGDKDPKAESGGATSVPASVRKPIADERRARPTTAASVGKRRAGLGRSPSKTSSRAGAEKGSERSAPPPTAAEPTVVERHAGPAVAAGADKGRAGHDRPASRKPPSSSKARAPTPNAGGRNAAATEPRRTSPTRSRPANAGSNPGSVPGSASASGGHGSGGPGGQGGGSGGQGSGGSGSGNSGHPRGP
jgi:hypothetical protein